MRYSQVSSSYIHGDVKLQNILVSQGTVKIADFGLAIKDMGQCKRKPVYAPFYRAPEVFSDVSNVTTKADIWAVGCLIWDLFVDLYLFDGDLAVVERQFQLLGYTNSGQGRLSFPQQLYDSLTTGMDRTLVTQLEDLLNMCLSIDVDSRITAEEALALPLFNSVRQLEDHGRWLVYPTQAKEADYKFHRDINGLITLYNLPASTYFHLIDLDRNLSGIIPQDESEKPIHEIVYVYLSIILSSTESIETPMQFLRTNFRIPSLVSNSPLVNSFNSYLSKVCSTIGFKFFTRNFASVCPDSFIQYHIIRILSKPDELLTSFEVQLKGLWLGSNYEQLCSMLVT